MIINLSDGKGNESEQKCIETNAGIGDVFNVVDTLSLRQILSGKIRIDTSKLSFVGRHTKVFNDGFLNIKWRIFKGFQIVTVHCYSLPALLYGSNVFSFTDWGEVDRALKIISERVSELLGISFDAHAAHVTKIDINRDFFVSALLAHYLHAIKKHEIARTIRRLYPENTPLFVETIDFSNKRKSIQFYAKQAQLYSEHPELEQFKRDFAAGILRLEVGLVRHALRQYVTDFFGTGERPAGKILTPEFTAYVINRTLCEVGLDREIPTFADYQNQIMSKIRKGYIAARLVKFMEDVDRLGVSGAKKKHKTFYYRKAQLEKVGLWRTFFADVTLPPLSTMPNDDWSMTG